MENQSASLTDEQSLEFLRDEYKLLHNSRASLISLNDSRANFFLVAISGAAVVLALLDKMQSTGQFSNLASLAILFIIFLLGTMTFLRTLEAHIGIVIYARGLNRIRRYFAERNKDLTDYLILPTTDKEPTFSTISFSPKGFSAMSLSTMIAALDGLIGGILVGVLLKYLFNLIDIAIIVATVLMALITFLILNGIQKRRCQMAEKSFKVQFPDPFVSRF